MNTSPAGHPRIFTYSVWRHGGWYTNVYYPSGACGCVSRNYPDGKWRIVCDERDGEHTYPSRDAAAAAEWNLAAQEWSEQSGRVLQEVAP